ncbi:MAG TPA: hypothetical protein VH761_13255 [Ilumatobacteraceae bacterium]
MIAIVTALTYVTVPTISRAASTSTTVEALLIGDSVLDGLSRPYGTAGRDKLAARHSIIVDTAGCRRLIMTSCRVPPNPAPPNAISVMRTRAGQYNRALVIATGYNDETTGRFGIDASVEAIMAEARQQGIDHVIWLTYREAGTAGNIRRFKASNKVLRNRHDRGLLVADWAVRSAALPADWFSTDGIHLGSEAVEAMADLIGDALDRLPKPRPKPPSSSCSGRARARPCLSLSSAADAELRTRPTQHRRVFRRPAR